MGRGKLIIFNFSTFAGGCNNLPESVNEIHTLQSTFHRFNASVRDYYRDLSRNQLFEILHELNKRDFRKYSYFVLAISSHGGRGGSIVTSDGKDISMYDHVMLPFIGNRYLSEIPKLFIVDTCKSGFYAERISASTPFDRNVIPKRLLICYATSEMGVAHGSIFTDTFCHYIREYGDSYSVQQIMQRTIDSVRRATGNKQIPIMEDFMRRHLVLGKLK
ncbi:caspase-3-like [Condylostylus longicornis]|uniref:caspase-3-like n=1 Tax=Condylostylus longicornis TaxID=2530218 RepID=UPI00244E29A2|nr:caspase-3-like [Condylostylus longicornis]